MMNQASLQTMLSGDTVHIGKHQLILSRDLSRSARVIDDVIRVKTLKSGKTVSLHGRKDWVRSMDFSHDGLKMVLCEGYDNVVHIGSTVTGEELHTLKGHTKCVRCVCFSPDGKLVASGSDDDTVRVWSVEDGLELVKMKVGAYDIRSLCFSCDNSILAFVARDLICVWSMEKKLHRISIGGFTNLLVCLSPDGSMAMSYANDGKLRVWSTETGKELYTTDVGDIIFSVCFSHTFIRILSKNYYSNALTLTTIEERKLKDVTQPLTFKSDWQTMVSKDRDTIVSFRRIAFSPCGHYILVVNKDDSYCLKCADTLVTVFTGLKRFNNLMLDWNT